VHIVLATKFTYEYKYIIIILYIQGVSGRCVNFTYKLHLNVLDHRDTYCIGNLPYIYILYPNKIQFRKIMFTHIMLFLLCGPVIVRPAI